MLVPAPHAWTDEASLSQHLEETGVNRRDFLAFCGSFAAMLGLDSRGQESIAAALQSVPRPAKIGEGELTIRNIRREGDKRVIVDVAVPPLNRAELFVEGPNEHWALPVPKLEQASTDGTLRFVFDLDGIPPGETSADAQLRLTLVGTNQAFEYSHKLK